MGAAGGVLAGLSPNSAAVAFGCAAAFSAGIRLRTEASLGIVAETLAAFLVTALVVGAPTGALLGFPFAYAGLWSVGLTRRELLVRAEQAEHTLAETRRAREAETHAAALAERARIARDIHDVLAHSLAAVSVNLQAAEGLLSADSLPADNPELAKAIECIDRAGHADPGGPGGGPPGRPGPARRRRAAARSAVVAGRPVPRGRRPGRGLHRHRVAAAAVRAGQPGRVPDGAGRADQRAQARARPARRAQPRVRGRPDHGRRGEPATARRRHRPLAAVGAGAGLAGLRERAALAGGTLEAGPADGTWRVCLRIPT